MISDKQALEWVIRRCTDLGQARDVEACMVRRIRHEDDRMYLSNLLIHVYAKCGSTDDANRIFQTTHNPNVYSWTLLVQAFAENGDLMRAKSTLDRMPQTNVVSWTLVVQGYARNGDLESAMKTFQAMPERNLVTWTGLVQVYAQQGQAQQAKAVFDAMPMHNLVSWNALLAAYGRHTPLLQQAQEVLDAMPEHSLLSWSSMVSAYADDGRVDAAAAVFRNMGGRDVVSWNSLIKAHIVAGDVRAAEEAYHHSMPEHNLITWNTMLAAYAQVQDVASAASMFNGAAMAERDVVSWNAMLVCYGQAGRMSDARRIFDAAVDDGAWDGVLHTSMAVAEEAKRVFDGMPQHSVVSWNAMLSAYGRCVDFLGFAKILFHSIPAPNVVSWNTLLTAYAQHGRVQAAQCVFDAMPERDTVSWNAMLVAAAVGGGCCRFQDMEELVSRMLGEGLEADQVSFLCLLLVCNHLGLVERGSRILNSMLYDHGERGGREHYSALVGVLGRSGQMKEAERVIHSMPLPADGVTWTALLGACAIHHQASGGGLRRARAAAKSVVQLEPHNLAPRVLLSNIILFSQEQHY